MLSDGVRSSGNRKTSGEAVICFQVPNTSTLAEALMPFSWVYSP
jgi:hypothetical protein